MARIRSIHPGAFTDEAVVALTPMARWFLVGLWCHAYDDGVFEWKPLGLKMKILPGDNVDTSDLLREIEEAGIICRFSCGGKEFGALRNFCKWQRPKKPNSSGVLPESLRSYVCLSDADSEPVRDEFGTSSGIPSQREEVGGRRLAASSLRSEAAAAARADFPDLEDHCRLAADLVGDDAPSLRDMRPIERLLADGFDLEADVLPTLRAKAAQGKRGRSWAFYTDAIREWREKSLDRIAKGKFTEGPGRPAPHAPTVFVKQDTDEWRAWCQHEASEGRKPPTAIPTGHGLGRYFASAMPPATNVAAA